MQENNKDVNFLLNLNLNRLVDWVNSKRMSISVLNDLRSYSRHWLTEFIETYRNEECLWQSKHPDYSNHALRNKAYDKLVEKLKEVEPNPDRAMVVRKINSLRSAFRREYRKTSTKTNYETRLWYFDKLLFIADQNPKRMCGGPKRELKLTFEDDSMEYEHDEEVGKGEGVLSDGGGDMIPDVTGNNIKTENNNSNASQMQQQQHQQQTTAVKVLEITTLDSNSQREIQQAVNSLEHHQQQMQQQMQNAHQAQQAQVTQIHHQQVPTIQIAREHLPTLFNSTYETPRHNDEFDAIGINVASKLRVMNPTQRIIAEKLISDVLFNGQLDNLNISSSLTQ